MTIVRGCCRKCDPAHDPCELFECKMEGGLDNNECLCGHTKRDHMALYLNAVSGKLEPASSGANSANPHSAHASSNLPTNNNSNNNIISNKDSGEDLIGTGSAAMCSPSLSSPSQQTNFIRFIQALGSGSFQIPFNGNHNVNSNAGQNVVHSGSSSNSSSNCRRTKKRALPHQQPGLGRRVMPQLAVSTTSGQPTTSSASSAHALTVLGSALPPLPTANTNTLDQEALVSIYRTKQGIIYLFILHCIYAALFSLTKRRLLCRKGLLLILFNFLLMESRKKML